MSRDNNTTITSDSHLADPEREDQNDPLQAKHRRHNPTLRLLGSANSMTYVGEIAGFVSFWMID